MRSSTGRATEPETSPGKPRLDAEAGKASADPGPPAAAWARLAENLRTLRAGARERERACEEICRAVVEEFGFSRALIATLDPKRERLITRAGYDPLIGVHVARALRHLFTIPMSPRPDGKLLAGAWAVQEDEQVHVPDASSYSFRPDRTAQRSTLVRAFGAREYVLTPIRGVREPFGLLAADRSRAEEGIRPEDLRLLRTLSSLVGLALEAAEAARRSRRTVAGERAAEKQPEMAGREEGRAAAERSHRAGRMQAVLDSLNQGVLVLGPQGELRYLNRAGSALLDILPWDAVGRPWREVLPVAEPERFARLLNPASGEPTGGGRRWILHPGSEDPAVVRVDVLPLAPVHAGQGIVLFLEDITEMTEEERARDEFLSMLVHDLSAPLQSVLGFAELLLMGRGGELSETQRDFISRIESGGRFMARLVEDILELTELETGGALLEPGPVEVRELVRGAVRGLGGMAEQASVGLATELPEELPTLHGDRVRLLQAIQNVVANAIEASGAGETVTVGAEVARPGGEPWLRVRVVDAGVGLSEEMAAHLFDKYRSYGRRKTRGRRSRGLGLPIARLVVEGHGGRIRADSRPGRGTTVTMELPLRREDD